MDAHGQAQVAEVRPITIAVVALGGEGGGVLADWIVDLAQHGGYLAQATSVPGVAQRTGATVYYVELFPKAQADGRAPVLALMPVPGDVDVVLASELMEAARAVERGFVTSEKTLLIASTHRVFAMTEKIALADGREDAAALLAACRDAARELVAFDMAALADATGSLLSAVLFGALAGSGTLPFARTAFEAAIRRGQVGVNSSLAAFAAGFEAAHSREAAAAAAASLEGGRVGGSVVHLLLVGQLEFLARSAPRTRRSSRSRPFPRTQAHARQARHSGKNALARAANTRHRDSARRVWSPLSDRDDESARRTSYLNLWLLQFGLRCRLSFDQ